MKITFPYRYGIRETAYPCRFPFIICVLLAILLIQKIPKLLIIQIAFHIPGIILRLHSVL